MDYTVLLVEFGVRFVMLGVLCGTAYLGLSVSIRGSNRFGDIEKWEAPLGEVFGVFAQTCVDMTRAQPNVAVCARFTSVEDDNSLGRLTRARVLYAAAQRRFSNLRDRPAGLTALMLLVSLLGAACFVVPMLDPQGTPFSLRDSALIASVVVGTISLGYHKRHVDDFEDLRSLRK
jgi:hypothetical protein